MPSAIIVRPDNSVERLDISGDLESLQKSVGGYVELLPLAPGRGVIAYINEMGKFDSLPDNLIANVLCNLLGSPLAPGDRVVGPMLLVGVPWPCPSEEQCDCPGWIDRLLQSLEIIDRGAGSDPRHVVTYDVTVIPPGSLEADF